MTKSATDEKILSYNDVVLRRSDLDILGGPYFLNDRIIEFYLSYLSSCYPSEDILLVPPSIAFWISNCLDADSLKDFLQPLNLSGKKLVIFPVNDNNDVTEAEGGSHWSLLAFERDANVFVHHDSYGGFNSRHAKQLYRAIVGYMEITNVVSTAKYLECSRTPQQVNGYDCGLYVATIARTICSWYGSGGPRDGDGLWFSVLNEQVTASVVAEMRCEILWLIRSLMAVK
ncbi:NEDD8-specific protease 1 [Actinidia eriantha]|uniref:NEDD8-specific protease 1 n=1 Tax=Actinidia eriantha TaxID=165200 RepID=UPI0025909758|nr:NEDD8-specific protease 1 [Actinidia eriantha]